MTDSIQESKAAKILNQFIRYAEANERYHDVVDYKKVLSEFEALQQQLVDINKLHADAVEGWKDEMEKNNGACEALGFGTSRSLMERNAIRNLDGVIYDVEHHGHDDVCLSTIKRVQRQLIKAVIALNVKTN